MRFIAITPLAFGGLLAPLFAQDPVLSFQQNGGAEFGAAVAGAGDVNRDGFPDFLVGQPDDAGRVVLYSGFSRTPLWVFHGSNPGDGLGATVAGIGDANGDGFDDVAASALEVSGNGAAVGQVYVVDGLTGQVAWTVQGDAADWRWGRKIDGAGDINADGYDDLLVGSADANPNGSFSGVARIYSGRVGSLLREVTGAAAFTKAGSGVAGAGDVNGDGFDDYIIGASGDDSISPGRGSATVYSGADGSVLYIFAGENDFDSFGADVDGGTDLNGDGVADFLIGADQTDFSGTSSGSVYAYSGADGTLLWRVDGPFAYNYFGGEVAAAGDLNADGLDDVIVGDPRGGADGDQNAAGVGYCLALSGADGSQIWRVEGAAEGDRLGQSVAVIGDFNNDGGEEVIVGAPADLSATGDGYVHVYSSTPRGTLLLGVLDLRAGAYSRAFIILAQPRSQVMTYWGTGFGTSAIPGVGRLDIRRPALLDSGTTNGAGNKWIGFYVPPQWLGRRITMQAIDEFGTKSLPISRVLQ